MKRTVLMVMVSAFAMQLSAQINEPGRFYITPKVGYNMANITLLKDLGADPRHAFHAGISFEYAFSEMISLEPGVFYSMQGSTFKIKKETLNTKNDCLFGLNNDYLSVPFLIKIYVADGLNVFAGPQLGYLMSSKIKVKTGYTLLDVVGNIIGENLNLTKYENELDMALVFGLGYQLANGFSISASYNLGVTNVTKIGDIKLNDKSFTINPDAKNSVLQVGIGLRF